MTFLTNNLFIDFLFFFDSFESSCLSVFYIKHFYTSYTIIISNSMVYMLLTTLFFLFFKFNVVINYDNYLISILKDIYSTLTSVVSTYVSYRHNTFSLLMSYIYIYIFINNFIGLIPFSNTINNHLNITMMISFVCWLGILFIGLKLFGTRLFSMFYLNGIPIIYIPFLMLIEILSYFFRFISLSLRLFANIVAGHLLLETIYVFIFKATLTENTEEFKLLIAMSVPIVFLMILIIFETVIAALQSYIFIVLCLIYLKDSLSLH